MSYLSGLMMRLRMSKGTGLWLILAFSLGILGAYITLDQIAPAGRRLVKIRGEDPVNYFGIAHSVLFDHDYNLNDEYEHMPLDGSPWGLGYSFMAVPLLALGTGVDALAGNPADGYSHWAVFFYCLASPLMAGIGLAALFLLPRSVAEYWRIMPEDHQSAYSLFVTLAIFFGTNVGYYAFSQMSHSSTFLFASLFLAVWWQVRDSESPRDWVVLGLVGGYLSICRWQDVLYLGGPILYDLFGGGWLKRSAWWRSRSLYAVGVGVWWVPQLLEWKAIYGKYLTIPQGDGIFSFPPPHVLQVLLSTENGWFICTPITVLGVAGLVVGAVKATRIYLPWIIVLTLQALVIGSVSFWSGLESFGARYMLSNMPLIGFGIITIFGASAVWMRRSVAVVCAVCCIFTSLFAIQFRLDLVPTESPLTFSELVTDKLRLPKVRQRRTAAKQAVALMAKGDATAAVRILEDALSLGEDRNVDMYLAQAYRAAGMKEQADAADLKYRKMLESRLF